MTKGAYYNENNREAAAWLRELIRRNLIAPGEVDERSIEDVTPADLIGFTQCHFFAGIGTWSYVLRRAGWPDDRRIWTGSCPCQPFSTAGKGAGFDDERHLWPAWFWLIRQCRPVDVVGEQVASRDGRTWLDSVYLDLEALDYTVGAIDLCAAGVGAPHIRQRIYFVAHASAQRVRDQGRAEDVGAARGAESQACERERVRDDAGDDGSGSAGVLADSGRIQHQRRHGLRHADGGTAGPPPQDCGGGRVGRGEGGERQVDVAADGGAGRMDDTDGHGLQGRPGQAEIEESGAAVSGGADIMDDADSTRHQTEGERSETETWDETRLRGSERGRAVGGVADTGVSELEAGGRGHSREAGTGLEDGADADGRGAGDTGRPAAPGPTNGYWGNAVWIPCRDGKARPVEPGTFPLAHGSPARVVRLRGYGNGIVAPAAEEVIRAYIGYLNDINRF